MANVRVCDRCGKTITRTKWGHLGALEYSYQFRKNYDLCVDCMKDFNEFIKGPSEGESYEVDVVEEE